MRTAADEGRLFQRSGSTPAAIVGCRLSRSPVGSLTAAASPLPSGGGGAQTPDCAAVFCLAAKQAAQCSYASWSRGSSDVTARARASSLLPRQTHRRTTFRAAPPSSPRRQRPDAASVGAPVPSLGRDGLPRASFYLRALPARAAPPLHVRLGTLPEGSFSAAPAEPRGPQDSQVGVE